MYTTLLLIRHGETSWNALSKIQGSTNISLSETGIQQATLLNQKLAGNFSAIYSSPLDRAFKTAQILSTSTSLNPIPVEDLSEVNFGKWEGLTFKEVEQLFPDAFKKWCTDPDIAPLVGGDGSLKACSIKGANALLDLVKKHPGETIAVVSHGAFIKCCLLGLFDLPMTMYHHIGMGNTCVNTIRFDEKLNPVIMSLNDTYHLQEGSYKCV